jgi:AraC family transcriptional regulator
MSIPVAQDRTFHGFYGQVTVRRDLPGVIITETSYPPGFVVPMHRHENTWLGFVVKGSVFETCGGREIECQPLALMVRMAGEAHSDLAGKTGGRALTVELKKPLLQLLDDCVVIQRRNEFQGGRLPSLMTRLYNETCQIDAVSPICIDALVLEMVVEAYRRSSVHGGPTPSTSLRQAMELVRARYKESLSLGDVAQQIGIHPVQLARGFRKVYGYSVGEYVRKLRVEFACRELLDSESPMADVALAAGFCDQAHFCRTFKRLVGINPSEFRVARRARP